jgi:hypothetical protein
VSLYFHQFIVNNYNFSKHCYYYYILLQRITCYNHCFSRSFCLLSVFLVGCLLDRGFCWRRLTLSVLLFRLTASSRPGFPYSPFSSNALSSGAIAEPSPACVLVPPFGRLSGHLCLAGPSVHLEFHSLNEPSWLVSIRHNQERKERIEIEIKRNQQRKKKKKHRST